MNKIYCVVWNQSLGTWVAVSETAKSKTKSRSKKAGVVAGLALVVAAVSSGALADYSAGGGTASGGTSIAIGNGSASAPATASAAEAIAMGATTKAAGSQSTVIGNDIQTSSKAEQAVVIGSNFNSNPAVSNGRGGVAIGSGLTTTMKSPVANGTGSLALGSSGDGATKVGGVVVNANGATTEGAYSAALMAGASTTTSAVGSIAFGVNAKVESAQSVAIGDGSAVGAGVSQAVAIGTQAKSQGLQAVALGAGASATSDGAIALGQGASAGLAGSVALGQGSKVTDATGKGYLTSTSVANTASVVSVGVAGTERRIQNVADGSANQDAVTVSQLKAAKTIADQQGTDTAAALGGGSKYDAATGGITAPSYSVGGTTVGSVGAAITNVDARTTTNSSNITSLQSQTFKIQANKDTATAVAAADTITFADGNNISITRTGNTISVATSATPTFTTVTSTGAMSGGSLAVTGAATVGGTLTTTGIANLNGGASLNGNRLTNVGAGTAGTDAVNLNQLNTAIAGAGNADALGASVATNLGGGATYNKATGTIDKLGYVLDDGTNGGTTTTYTNVGDALDNLDGRTTANTADIADLASGKAGLVQQANNTAEITVGKDSLGTSVNFANSKDDARQLTGVASAGDYTLIGNANNAVNAGDLNTAIGNVTDTGFNITSNGDLASDNVKLGETVDFTNTDSNLVVSHSDNGVNYNLADNVTVDSVTAVGTPGNTAVFDSTGTYVRNDNGNEATYGAAAVQLADRFGNSVNITKGGLSFSDTNGDATGPSIKVGGIDAGSKQISRVASAGDITQAMNAGNAVNAGDVNTAITKLNTTLTNTGFNITSDGESAANPVDTVKLGESVKYTNDDGNLVANHRNNEVVYDLANDIAVDSVTAADGIGNDKAVFDSTGTHVRNGNANEATYGAAAVQLTDRFGNSINITKGGLDFTDTKGDATGPSIKVGGIDAGNKQISQVGSAGTLTANNTNATSGADVFNAVASATTALTNTGLNFTATDATAGVVNKKLGETLTIQGGITDTATVSSGENVITRTDNKGNINVELAKNSKFDSITTTGTPGNTAVLNSAGTYVRNDNGNEATYGAAAVQLADRFGNSVNITKGGLSFSDTNGDATGPSIKVGGIDAGSKQISRVASAGDITQAVNAGNAVNAGDVNTAMTKLTNNGFKITSNGATANVDTVALGETVDFTNSDGNLVVSHANNKVTYNLASDITANTITADDGKGNSTVLSTDGTYVTNAAGGEARYGADGSGVSDGAGNATIVTAEGSYSVDKAGNQAYFNAQGVRALNPAGTQATILDNTGTHVYNDTTDNEAHYTADGITVVDAAGNSTVVNQAGLSFTDTNGVATGPSITAGGINAGGERITNVADAVALDDAVTLGQALDVAESLGTSVADNLGGGSKYDPATNTVTAPTYTLDDGSNTGTGTDFDNVGAALGNLDGRTTANTADIADLTDNLNNGTIGLVQQANSTAEITVGKDSLGTSVNFANSKDDARQLTGVASAGDYTLIGNANNAVNAGDLNTAIGNVTDTGFNITSNGDLASDNVKLGETVDFTNTDSNLVVSHSDNGVNYNLADDITVDSVTAGNTTLDTAGVVVDDGSGSTATLTSNGTEVVQLDGNGDLVQSANYGSDGLYTTNQDGDIGAYTNQGFGVGNQNDGKATIGTVDGIQVGEFDTTTGQLITGATYGANGLTAIDVAGNSTVVNQAGLSFTDTNGVATGPSITAGGINAGGERITNVADAVALDDAVTLGQALDVAESLGTSVADNLGGGSKYDPATNTVTAPTYTLDDGSNTGTGTDFDNVGDALGNLDGRTTANTADIADLTDNLNNGTIGLVQQANNTAEITVGKDSLGTSVSFANADGDARQLTNVANGVNATDAANMQQLTDLTTALGGNVDPNTGVIIAPEYNVNNYSIDPNTGMMIVTPSVVNNVGDALNSIGGQINNLQTSDIGIKYFRTNSTQSDAVALGEDSIAIGPVSAAQQQGNRTISMGVDASSAADSAIAIGDGATVAQGADQSIAIGNGAQVNGQQSISIGTGNIVNGDRSGAIGDPSIINGSDSYSVGNNNTVDSDDTFVLGNNVTSTVDGSVVLGSNSAATTGAGVAGYALQSAAAADQLAIDATTSTTGAVAVGDAASGVYRQITGVAAGTEDSDAVNVAQLKAVDNALASLTSGIGNGSIGLVQQVASGATITVGAATGGTTVNFAGTDGDRQLTGVAASGQNNAAATVGQIRDMASALGGGAAVNADGTLTAPTYNVQGGTQGNVGDALGALDTALNDVRSANQSLNNAAVQYDKNADGTVNKGQITLGGGADGTTLTNVRDGALTAGSKDAVNGGQLYETNQQVNNLASQISNGTVGLVQQAGNNAQVTVAAGTGGTSVNMAGTAGNRTVTGVQAGAVTATSNDAINGAQLHASNTSVANALGGGAAVDASGNITAPTYQVAGETARNVGDALTKLDNQNAALGNRLDQAFYRTNERIDKVEKRANAGIAAALSMESAPFVPGKFTYSLGAGFHGGENAIGATLRRTSDSGRWSLTGGVATASEGGASARVGISGIID